ncbi:MAG: hypothetical protein E7L00_08345 [Propionibacteriaceae bacterium]|nr:hypothetical protein [Propionibacteriaceae bacterium]
MHSVISLLGAIALGIWAYATPPDWFRTTGLTLAVILGITSIVIIIRQERRASERHAWEKEQQ